MIRRYAARRVAHPLDSVDVWVVGGEVVIGQVSAEPHREEEWGGWFDDGSYEGPRERPTPTTTPRRPPAPPRPKRGDSSGGRAAKKSEERAAALRTLGLAEGATKREVRKRYRTLCLERHPDRGGSTAQMASLNAAWEKLR